MSSRWRRATGGCVGLVLVALLPACADAGDVSFRNDSASDVTVSFDDEWLEVSSNGGTVLLDVDCIESDVEVRYASGDTVVLRGPVCSDQEVLITEETASLVPAATVEG